MKKKNLLLFMLLTVCFVFCLKCNVEADTYPGSGYNLSYSVANDAISITGCSTTESSINVVIPEKIDDLPVTNIGNAAFRKCKSLISITIPDSVISIENNAFCDCKSLTSINIPNKVTSIADSAFYGCESLSSITIPNSVTSIGICSFLNCKSLSSITIPDTVTTVGDGAFYGCDSLKSITIPDSITSIGYRAFGYKDDDTHLNGFMIYGTPGSQAEIYAKENNITFIDKSHSNHTYGAWTIIKAATCTLTGMQTRTCTICGRKESRTIPATGHTYGAWLVTQPASVFIAGIQTRTCTVCGASETANIAKVNPSIKLSKYKVNLKRKNKKKKSAVIKVSNIAKGDYVVSWKSSKKKVATVNAKGKIVAKKKGKANITVTLASGLKAVVKVTVK